MSTFHKIMRIGLCGTPGAGKTTTSRFLESYCLGQQYFFDRIKLADPIYEAQAAIYAIAGRKLSNFYEQDGELLNFLGYYLRKINQNVLLDRFAERLVQKIEIATRSNAPFGIVICDDVRAPDAEFVKTNDFLLIRLLADEQICTERRHNRGDITLGSAKHSTEQGLDEITAHYQIENNTTLEDLRIKVIQIVENMKNDSDR
jgi:dephospho-CoA kinase